MTEKQPSPAVGPATGKKSPKWPYFQPLFLQVVDFMDAAKWHQICRI
jgi:hypothetical protein